MPILPPPFPDEIRHPEDDALYDGLIAALSSLDRLAVAVSGGADSALLLRAAVDALGPERVVALTALSPTLPAGDRDMARRLVERLAVRHVLVSTQELDLPEFAANPPDRCYVCKRHRLETLIRALEDGIPVADGENTDDADDYRPGRRAALELGILGPLRDAGLDKAAVRRLSRRLGLETWDRPASACLASRIPYGMTITARRLERIDAAEEILRGVGLRGPIRARLVDDRTLRIEVAPEERSRLMAMRSQMEAALAALGFPHVHAEDKGYRRGAWNEDLPHSHFR